MADEGGAMVHNLETARSELLVSRQRLPERLHVIAYRSYRVRLRSQHA